MVSIDFIALAFEARDAYKTTKAANMADRRANRGDKVGVEWFSIGTTAAGRTAHRTACFAFVAIMDRFPAWDMYADAGRNALRTAV